MTDQVTCPRCGEKTEPGTDGCRDPYCPLSARGWARDTEHAKQMSSILRAAGCQ